MNPKIISLSFTTPPYVFSQREIFDGLRYPPHFWRVFRNSQIEQRYFTLPLDRTRSLSFQEQQEEYLRQAPALAEQALLGALDGRDPKDIGLLIYATCTGFPPGPTISHYLVSKLGLRHDIQINNISSHGCEAAFPGLRRCYDFTTLTSIPSAAISLELCSLTYYPELDGKPDPENDYELFRSNAIFGDGCACAIIGFDDSKRHPRIIDFASHLDISYSQDLGYVWRNGRLRVRLSRRVPELATELIVQAVEILLAKRNLTINDISYWVFHTPGALVLDKLRDKLGLAEENLKYSRKSLKLFGNMSSASVGSVGKILMNEELNPKGYLVMANVGPGMVGNATLLCFGDK